MASKLRKFKYSDTSSGRPNAPATSVTTVASDSSLSTRAMSTTETAALKADIITSLRADISAAIKSELKNALADDFNFIRSELQEVKSEIANSAASTRSEMDAMKSTISDVENGLSTWSDEVVTLQTTVAGLKAEMANMKERCEDMEGRMRRCNIRIVGIPEEPGSCSTTSVSRILKDVLHLQKDILVDRSHRGFGPRKPNGKPRVVIAKLHYFQDCVDVLRRARESGPLKYNGAPVAIFPDYTASVAKARAAFNEVRGLLRGRQGVRFGILFPARLRISFKGDDKEFQDPATAMAYVKSTIARAEDNG